jgi:hypothetical protein
VLKVVAKVRQWWKTGPLPPSSPPVPYQVACVCGTVAQGFRQVRHQVVTCAGCGRKVFVLPASPLPATLALPAQTSGPSLTVSRSLKPWRLPLLAAGLTLMVVILVITTFLYFHLHPSNPARKPKTIGQHIEAGRTALAQGKFLLAARELEAAQETRTRHPDRLSAVEHRELNQLQREAGLLASLLSESLGEVLQHAAELVSLDEQEWQRVFAERYRGKALVFDAEVQRDGAGQYRISYAVFVRGRQARLDLTNLHMLKGLPLQQPQRLLFGLRLADIRLEAEGIWVIRFEPDSGVLLTDLGAAVACCSQPAEELKDLVERQAEWLTNRP